MTPRTNGVTRAQRSKSFEGERPNWILIAGGALLSTLSIRLGYKLKQVLNTKQPENANNGLHGYGDCFNANNGTERMVDTKQQANGELLGEPEIGLPLVTVFAPEYTKENGVIWASSPDCLVLPQKPFHHSNSSDSPCVSESGSDIFSKREVAADEAQLKREAVKEAQEATHRAEELSKQEEDHLAQIATLEKRLE
ncbi:hypothetical protein RJ640_014551 [Escallonia rubra]|uniref:Uncharacterized protein n=1 Tax=Escallonia rubra TaxID=112253 RepID=A0AA88R6T3_9ASTE|nr:hypothetical protein RJ640_014551 [Escallonia rubra]